MGRGSLIAEALVLLGAVAVVVGVAMWNVPAAVIVAGVMLVAAGLFVVET